MPALPPVSTHYETLSDFKQSGRKRLADAYELLEPPTRDKRRSRQHNDGAVYLAGYALECALKAFLIRKAQQNNPSVGNLLEVAQELHVRLREVRSHKLADLRDHGALLDRRGIAERKDFDTCLKWDPEWRYQGERIKTGMAPREFVDAMQRMCL
jgi:HEPN domain-containing protein